MSLENLTTRYKEIKEKLRADFSNQVEYVIELGERLITIENNISILTEKAEKRLIVLEQKLELMKNNVKQLTLDVRHAEDVIRDLD